MQRLPYIVGSVLVVCSLVACNSISGATPTEELATATIAAIAASSTPSPEAVLGNGDCTYWWAYQDDPALTARFQEALDDAEIGDVTGEATLFGEECTHTSGKVDFGAMEVDYDATARVPDIEDTEALGGLALRIIEVIESLRKRPIGNISITFASEGQEVSARFQYGYIDLIRQHGLTGTDAWDAMLDVDCAFTISLSCHDGYVLITGRESTSFAFSPDGTTLAFSSGHEISTWDVGTGEQLLDVWVGENAWVLAFSANQDALIAGFERQIKRWDVASGTLLETIEAGTEKDINTLAVSPDGTKLAWVDWDGTIVMRDMTSGKTLWRLATVVQEFAAMAFDPTGEFVAIADGGESPISILEAATGNQACDLPTELTGQLVFSPDGGTLASFSYGDQAQVISRWDWQACNPQPAITILDEEQLVLELAFAPGGELRALIEDRKAHQLILMDAASQIALHTIALGESESIYDAILSPDGLIIATDVGELIVLSD